MSSMSAEDESLLIKDVADDEYSTNFFNFTAKAFHDRVLKTIIPEAVEESTARLKKFLLQHCAGYKAEIDSAFVVLLNESLEPVPGLSNTTKDLTDSHFKIPKTVLLEEDLIQSDQYDEEDVRKMDMEIASLEDRITKASFMEAFFEEELELAAKFKEVMTGSNAVDLAMEISKMGANITNSELKNTLKHFNLKEKKKGLIKSKASHKSALQGVEHVTHRHIYEEPKK